MKTPSRDTLKNDFLIDPNIIFLNHGSFGATPRPVFNKYQDWQMQLEKQPVEFLGRNAPNLLSTARQALGEYLNTNKDNLVFVTNATVGLNIVAHSLKLKPGDEVLTTDHEYGALDKTWTFLARTHGFFYKRQPIPVPICSEEHFLDSFYKGITSKTKVIFISQITSPTAIIFPIKAIIEKAKTLGIITIVDGAHAPGQIPVDLDDLDADFYSGNLHKWLCAPKGAGFLYAPPKNHHYIDPLVVSWGWDNPTITTNPLVDYIEWMGTRDISAFLSVSTAIDYQKINHWDEFREKCHQLAAYTQTELSTLLGIKPYHPNSADWFMQMAALELPGVTDPLKLKTTLYEKYKIEVPIIEWNGRVLIRFSFQAYNDQNDADALISALKSELTKS